MVGVIFTTLFFGGSVASLLGLLAYAVQGNWLAVGYREKQWVKAIKRTCTALLFAVSICGPMVGAFALSGHIEAEDSTKWVQAFKIEKATLEISISSDRLTGYEKTGAIVKAADINGELAKRQYRADKWYGIFENREVLELEPIFLE